MNKFVEKKPNNKNNEIENRIIFNKFNRKENILRIRNIIEYIFDIFFLHIGTS